MAMKALLEANLPKDSALLDYLSSLVLAFTAPDADPWQVAADSGVVYPRNEEGQLLSGCGVGGREAHPFVDTLAPFLFSANLKMDLNLVDALCSALAKQLNLDLSAMTQGNATTANVSLQPQRLAQPQQLSKAWTRNNASALLQTASVDLSHVASTRARQVVLTPADRERMERLQQKQEQKRLKREQQKLDSENDFSSQNNEMMAGGATSNQNLTSRDVHIENFDISFAGRTILQNASLHLAFGRRYGLIGRNGIGKSTLLRALSQRHIAFPKHLSILHVEQEVRGDETSALQSVLEADEERTRALASLKRIETALSVVEKDEERMALENELKSVYAQLEACDADSAEARAAQILAGLGFSAASQSQPTKQFSGGWRMRIALARALFAQPDVLCLDEPSNMLDMPAVVWLERYLRDSWTKTLLVVSHDRAFLDEITTDIILLSQCQLTAYRGHYSTFVATRAEQIRCQKREYEAQVQYRQHLQEFIDRFRYNAKRAAQAQSKIKILEKLPPLQEPDSGDNALPHFPFPVPDALTLPIVQMDQVSFSYSGKGNGSSPSLLAQINFSVDLDSRIAIVGPNGAGKSTLLKLLIGQLEPTEGFVTRNARLKIGYFSQHHADTLLTMQKESSVAFLISQHPQMNEEACRRHLGSFGLQGPTALQPMRTLSGGQKSRIVFAHLALLRPHVLILDEPSCHLDMESIDALVEALERFEGGVVVVSHDERFIQSACREIWVCAEGRFERFDGTIQDYKKSLDGV